MNLFVCFVLGIKHIYFRKGTVSVVNSEVLQELLLMLFERSILRGKMNFLKVGRMRVSWNSKNPWGCINLCENLARVEDL